MNEVIIKYYEIKERKEGGIGIALRLKNYIRVYGFNIQTWMG